MDQVYIFFGKNFFNIQEVDTQFNGSGDKLYNYLETFSNFLLVIPVSLILLLTIKKPTWISAIKKIFYIAIRYYLAYTLLGYGFLKLSYQQFSPPTLFNLDQPVGNMSPMGLAWTYMGYSKAYTMFSGAAEMLGAILLLFRRTTLLGAIILFAVMFNVMMMNYCYDIPVKIFSTHLVFWAFLLMFGFDRRLLDFILQRRTEPNVVEPYFTSRRWRIATNIIKYTAIVLVAIQIGGYAAYKDETPRPLKGIYKTQLFVLNKHVLQSGDSLYWPKLIVDSRNFAMFKREDGRRFRLSFEVDTVKRMINVSTFGDKIKKGRWEYSLKDSILTLKGNVDADTLEISLKQFDHNAFLLTKRGFHWVNEFPYNN